MSNAKAEEHKRNEVVKKERLGTYMMAFLRVCSIKQTFVAKELYMSASELCRILKGERSSLTYEQIKVVFQL